MSLDDSVFLFEQEAIIDKHLDRRTVTFVVRLWSEYLEQPSPAWRGEIECVANSNWPGQEQSLESGQRWTFGNLEELLSFLQQQTSPPVRGTGPPVRGPGQETTSGGGGPHGSPH